MLAYSSIAHTGFLLTGVLGVQAPSELGDGEVTSLQAVLFYLAMYGFATIGAFAIVTLVRDASGEAHLVRAVDRARPPPRCSRASFGLFLLSMAGIPLTAGFMGKFAVFTVARRLVRGPWCSS